MAYCTIQDVKDDFKNLTVESTSTITEDKITKIIAQESATIDGIIGVRYVTPVAVASTTSTMLILNKICIFLCAERIKNILEVKTGASQMSSEIKQPMNYVRTPKDDLKDIAKGIMLLPEATLLSSQGGMNSFLAESCHTHEFDITKKQW